MGVKPKAQMNPTQLAAYEAKKERETATRKAGTPTHWPMLSCACPGKDLPQRRGAIVGRLLESGCPHCGQKKRWVWLPAIVVG